MFEYLRARSGRVNFDDWWIWWENFGFAFGAWPWIPGKDVDSDFNNDNAVTLVDIDRRSLNWGKEYPFVGAR